MSKRYLYILPFFKLHLKIFSYNNCELCDTKLTITFPLHMKKYFWQIRLVWKDVSMAVIFFVLSLFVYMEAFWYANKVAGNVVTDIFLDHLPHLDVIPYLAYGTVIFYWFVFYILIKKPINIPFVLKTVALFIFMRSFFMILTHIAPQPTLYFPIWESWMSNLLQWADLFFSGHTGLPFLLALIYWKNRTLRIMFLCTSVVAAIWVLLARLHYSIDVFAAYFIVYGTYQISTVWFRKNLNKLIV
jgi:hypothetical protein